MVGWQGQSPPPPSAEPAVTRARAAGIKAGLFRPVTVWPFPSKQLLSLSDTAKAFLSVELNMGQMVNDVKLAVECRRPVEFYGRTGGMIPTVDEVYDKIISMSKSL